MAVTETRDLFSFPVRQWSSWRERERVRVQVEGGVEVEISGGDRGLREKEATSEEKEKWAVGGGGQQVQGQEAGLEGQVLPHLQQRSLSVPSGSYV